MRRERGQKIEGSVIAIFERSAANRDRYASGFPVEKTSSLVAAAGRAGTSSQKSGHPLRKHVGALRTFSWEEPPAKPSVPPETGA